MNLKRLFLSGSLALGFSLTASASTFDFESTAAGFTNTLSVIDSGLTLTVTSSGGWVYVGGSGVGLLGSRSVIGSQSSSLSVNGFSSLKFSFSSLVTSATFRFGDAGGDNDSPVHIYAYDSLSNLISSITETYPSGFASGKSATWTGSGASYFILDSTPGYNDNSLWWEVGDVVSGQSVSDTANTLGLGVLSLVGLVAFRRRFVRA